VATRGTHFCDLIHSAIVFNGVHEQQAVRRRLVSPRSHYSQSSPRRRQEKEYDATAVSSAGHFKRDGGTRLP
jgi:hypothetical protein